MPRVWFTFLFHLHQPIGQAAKVLDDAFRLSYRPVLEIIEAHPDLKFSLHLSGPLIEEYRSKRPGLWKEIKERVQRLLERGQVKLVGGTAYEAILPLIPDEDKRLQLLKGRKILERELAYHPKGFWLPERVWEPHIAKYIADAGYRFVMLDDEAFFRAGYSQQELRRPYLTEESGRRLVIFPIDGRLRNIVPWRPVEEAISHILSKAGERGSGVFFMADAEKFGFWGENIWAHEWLNEFLSRIEADERIVSVTMEDYLGDFGVGGLAYLPTASYDRMMEWSKGNFRNFLTKFVESNWMHKRVLYARTRLELVRTMMDRSSYEEALDHIHRAECNDPYWAGLFGGIYILSPLRQSIYEELIRAERIVWEARRTDDTRIGMLDLDYDGREEILLESRDFLLALKPDDGGSLVELDLRTVEPPFNLTNTLTRVPEEWHRKLEEAGVKPAVDWYRRTSLRDHFLPLHVGPEALAAGERRDVGDFATGNYSVESLSPWPILRRSARLKIGQSEGQADVLKFVRIRGGTLAVNYSLRIEGEVEPLRFAVEFCLTPYIQLETARPVVKVGSRELEVCEAIEPTSIRGVAQAEIKDEIHGYSIRLSCENVTDLWVASVDAVYTDEGKRVRKSLQGFMLAPTLEVRSGEQSLSMELSVSAI